MQLNDIFDHLVSGELHTVAIGQVDPATGELSDENKRRMLSHINAGLDALHARFTLRQETLKVLMVPGLLRYRLAADNALSTSWLPRTKYIDDSVVPFDFKLYQILEVRDADGVDITPSIKQPRFDLIELPEAVSESHEYISVDCRVSHRKLTEIDLDIDHDLVEVNLPYAHLEALGYFIASRIHNPVGMQDEMGQGINYSMKYEAACQALENEGFQLDESMDSDRAARGGWC